MEYCQAWKQGTTFKRLLPAQAFKPPVEPDVNLFSQACMKIPGFGMGWKTS
jgi:hypothetical protein